MKIDLIKNPELAGRYQVIDVETGEEIEGVGWADDDVGEYHTVRMRGRTLGDAADVDLRIVDKSGAFKFKLCQGEIEIVDLAAPLKAPLLALLDDPEVVEAIRRAVR